MLIIKKNIFYTLVIYIFELILIVFVLSGCDLLTQTNNSESNISNIDNLSSFDAFSNSCVDSSDLVVIILNSPPPSALLYDEPLPPKSFDEVFSYAGLIELKEVDSSFVLDIKNATSDNITGTVQYEHDLCLIHIDAAKALIEAQKLAIADGYRIKIWDAYRPLSVQTAMNQSLPHDKKHFVPPPSSTSQHCRGIAVDITLVDENGVELDMPTDYCEFTNATYANYSGATTIQIQNREYLKSIMAKAGFRVLNLEWWHYYLPSYKNYDQLDLSFGDYLKHRQNSTSIH